MRNVPINVTHGMAEIDRQAWHNQFISEETIAEKSYRDLIQKRPRLKETEWIKIKGTSKAA
jgi:hypothetical protein